MRGCSRRHRLSLPLWCPVGGLPSLPPAVPCLYLLFCPHPPDPLPAGKGEIFSFLMQGAKPLASPGLNPGGTGAGGESRAGGGLAPALLACPAADVSGGVACFLCCLPTLPLVYFSAPYPPDPLPRRGRGDQGYFMQGASPLASPGLNPGGAYGTCQENAKRGACPGVADLPLAAAVPGGRAVPPPCLRDLPEPSPAGGRGREVSQRRGWQAAKGENFPPVAAPCKKIFKSP